jgi:predicted nucleotidyltransferase
MSNQLEEKHGLTERDLRTIGRILKVFQDEITSAALFGSRAKGTPRLGSDIDLAIYGNLTEHTIGELRSFFEASSLPYKVDVVAYDDKLYPPLKEHIDAVALPLFNFS